MTVIRGSEKIPNQRQWQLLLRRAYGIPDAVSDETALMVISRIFVREHQGVPTMFNVAVADDLFREVIDIVLEMFTESVFDKQLLPEPLREHLSQSNDPDPIYQVPSHIVGSHWQPDAVAPITEITSVAQTLVAKVCAYAVEHSELIDISQL